jgi:hypothetical protein
MPNLELQAMLDCAQRSGKFVGRITFTIGKFFLAFHFCQRKKMITQN